MKLRDWYIRFATAITLIIISLSSQAQTPTDTLPKDPGGVFVYTLQNMAFGAFSHGASGGTVIIGADASRTVTGDVIALNLGFQYYNAQFEVEAPPGTILNILNGPDATLTGSNGGSMSLHIGASSPVSPITTTVSPPTRTQVNIGGTLTVGNNAFSPPGAYSGTFYVTFNYE